MVVTTSRPRISRERHIANRGIPVACGTSVKWSAGSGPTSMRHACSDREESVSASGSGPSSGSGWRTAAPPATKGRSPRGARMTISVCKPGTSGSTHELPADSETDGIIHSQA